MKTQPTIQSGPSFIGIDYHKRYSVYCVVDTRGDPMVRGRIDHSQPEGFVDLMRRWPGCRVVFEGQIHRCQSYNLHVFTPSLRLPNAWGVGWAVSRAATFQKTPGGWFITPPWLGASTAPSLRRRV